MKKKFPAKPIAEDLSDELSYSKQVIEAVEQEGCYKEGAKTKTYSVTLKSPEHLEQKLFQESPHFQEKAKERYKIEAKNSELKHRHGYDVTSSSGLVGMEMQGAMAIFTVNLNRIMKLMKEPKG